MAHRKWHCLVAILFLLGTNLAVADDHAPEPSRGEIEFFEKSVRPLLISACADCHGEKKQWSAFRVDSRERIVAGGELGTGIVPGEPDKSPLIEAVRRTGDIKMPPENPLSQEQIAVLEKWVAMKAPWPKESAKPSSREQLHKSHWAFQPISRPQVPAVKQSDWCRTDVDRFVLEQLEAASITPSPQADRRTLIRRLSYDLTGLPPSQKEVAEFEHDQRPDAYAQLVERLMNSPQYGEHWGRFWLDLARYADTKGYMFGWEISRFVHSATYRDWVINAFNTDLPYDRFLLLQIAADQAAADDPTAQAAMGFLTVGRKFLGNEHDIIDDRIDVLGRTTMGLTFGCARCHDHKYDPIPTADYYSLYGVFKNSTEQLTRAVPPTNVAPTDFEKDLAAKQKELADEIQKMRDQIAARMRGRITDYLIASLTPENHPNIPFSQIIEATDIFPVYVERTVAYLRKTLITNDPVFTAWHRYAAVAAKDFEARSAGVTRELQSLPDSQFSPLVKQQFIEPPKSMKEVAERYGTLLTSIDQEWKSQVEAAEKAQQPRPTAFDNPEREKLRQVLYGLESPCLVPNTSLASISTYFAVRTELPAIWKFHTAIENLLLDTPAAPAYSLRMIDCEVLEDARVFRRGNPLTRGDEVPRRFPSVVAGNDRPSFQNGSGRLELAQGIVDRNNPLTARVWVNRIWQRHFGMGIVPTPSDFGIRAATPKQLKLLDWLATRLIDSGYSTKAIHREILLSSAYQQRSDGPSDPAIRDRAAQVDPENELIWKANPHRLTFEELRDSMLAATGELDRTTGGRAPALFMGADANNRRSVYGFVDRQSLSNVYRVFDFANPDLHIPVRSETTVSQQALFALNHPFVAARARHLAGLMEAVPSGDLSAKIDLLFEKIYQRPPTPAQREAAIQFVSSAEVEPPPQNSQEQLAWQYGYGAMKEDFTGTSSFERLPFFNGNAWQGGDRFPDTKLGWAQLTADGGHPGNDHGHAVIRRWTAPVDATISINAEAKHEVAAGNGIRCSVFSNRGGVLNQFPLHNSVKTVNLSSIAVKAGDTIDFVVDINGELNSDQHRWTITIQETTPVAGTTETTTGRTWNSQRDFVGPPVSLLKPWEQLVQVLLLSNEFLFVD